nr:putative uncharacterized protein DDB_G0282133 isoform X2 [Maniola hyperantus]
MSLLEDVFLEDEANEAQELERVIEGDEFDERPRSRSDSENNSEREDEAEEEKKRVDPSTKARRVIKNPRFILNPARLTGPRGIQVIPEHFKDFKFKGKGHEKEDLDLVLKKLEHWAYRLYPKFKFEDCLKKIETLGKKRPVMVHLHKIRTDQYLSEETVVQRDSSDDEAPNEAPSEAPPEDEFDKLLQQQIELARATSTPASVKKGMESVVKENRTLMMPIATSSPSISEEQRARILKSRKLAEERRLARLKNASNTINTSQNHENIANISKTPSKSDNTTFIQNKMSVNENNTTTNANTEYNPIRNIDNIANTASKTNTHEKALSDDEIDKINRVNTENIFDIDENHVGKVKKARKNVIDSSDEDGDIVFMNESIKANVHKVNNDKRYINGIKGGPKETDDKVLEIRGNSSNDQQNDSSSEENDIVLMNESVRADLYKGPKQIDKIFDDVILEIDENSNNNQENNNSPDEDDVVLMNESVRVDVHETDSDKGHTKGMKQGPKLTAGHTINDNVILEIIGNSDDNDNLDIKKSKSHHDVNEKKATTKVHGIKESESASNKIFEIDNNEAFDNLDHNNAKIDKENGLAMIITESNTSYHVISYTDVDMASNEQSSKVNNSQETKHNAEVEENQEAIFSEKEVPVERVSENAVENNLDLMDVEFDDEF